MGRGYSANRSMTQRPANKEKRTRSRSVSLTRLKNRIGEITQVGKSKEEIAEAMQHIDSDDEVYASEDENETVARQDVLTKYKMCGTVTDKAVQLVVDACVTGARTIDLCKLGDTFVEDSLRKMFQKSKTADGEKMKKGLCFPTTVSVNNALCHHTPFGERDSVTLRNGDVVKVSVACHVDGYPTTSAQTIVVGLAQGETGIDAATANALAATNFAMNGMIRLMQPEMDNHDITDYITHVAKTFGVETVEAVLSNRTKRWILDGQQCIIARRVLTEDPQQNVGDCQIGPFQVWTLDVAFTTSKSYRMKALDEEVNIYRRNEIATIPRHAASEALMKEVSEKYMCFPWSPSRTENPLRTRLGIVELKKHDMLDSFPVLGSARGTYTTRASCTVAVTDKRVNVLSGSPYELHPTVIANATASPTREMLELLTEPLVKEKKVKKQGAIETAATANVDPEGDDDPDAPIERSRKAHRSGR